MLQVTLNNVNDDIEIRFKYNITYINRIKSLGGVSFNAEEKFWTISRLTFPDFEEEFQGEIMYMTPKWVINNEPPPDYSKIYNQVSNVKPSLKAPYSPYPFQSFGANFLATMAIKFGYGCLFDDMGTGDNNLLI